jgi:hypothetical protein
MQTGRVPSPDSPASTVLRRSTAAARDSKSKGFFGRPLEAGTEARPLQRQPNSNSTFTFVFTTVQKGRDLAKFGGSNSRGKCAEACGPGLDVMNRTNGDMNVSTSCRQIF